MQRPELSPLEDQARASATTHTELTSPPGAGKDSSASSPPPQTTPPISIQQDSSEAGESSPSSPSLPSLLVLRPDSIPTAKPLVGTHRGYQEARERIKQAGFSGARARKKIDASVRTLLKERDMLIELQRLENRALLAERDKAESEKLAAVCQQEVLTLKQAICMENTASEVKAMKAREMAREDADTQILQADSIQKRQMS